MGPSSCLPSTVLANVVAPTTIVSPSRPPTSPSLAPPPSAATDAAAATSGGRAGGSNHRLRHAGVARRGGDDPVCADHGDVWHVLGAGTSRSRSLGPRCLEGAHVVVARLVLELDEAERFEERWQVDAEAAAEALLRAVPTAHRVVR